MTRIFSSIQELGVPVITFGVGASHLAKEWHDLPVDVVGLDWRLSIKEAREMGLTKTLQGNLDPSLLLADWSVIEERTKEIIDQGVANQNHIFNLGHGVFPEVNPETLKRLTNLVHEYSRTQMKAHS
jgi:uroporphyrinogen decarboxylase